MKKSKSYKTEQLILYICSKMGGDSSFGSIKMNKALYYVDCLHYLHTGNAMSTFSYVRQPNGPTPRGTEFLPVRKKLINEGKLEINTKPTFIGKDQQIPKNLVAPDLTAFTAEEVSFVDDILRQIRTHNATSISDFSHDHISWQMVENNEALPLCTFLLSEADITDEDEAIAKEWIKEYNEKAA